MSKTYKYVDDSNEWVHIFDEDGITRSSAVVSEIPEGSEILPADPVPVETPVDPLVKLQAFLAANPDVAALINS